MYFSQLLCKSKLCTGVMKEMLQEITNSHFLAINTSYRDENKETPVINLCHFLICMYLTCVI
jgi:hypothetical protein